MKRHLIIATAAAAALIAGGTVTAVAANSDSASGSAQSSAPQTARHTAASTAQVQDGRSSIPMTDDADDQGDLREANAAKVTAPDAAAAALKAVPGTVTALDLDADRPGLVWDAEVLGKDGKQHELTLDAGTARVLNQHLDRGDNDDRAQQRTAQNARTTAADAARTAAPHGTVTSVELDDDNGPKPAWEVDTVTKDGKQHTVLVDPQSGKLSAAPSQDNDDNDNDDSDD
ncbi:PepSY domain-containing protein [Streptomyces sioyaensis]|uniref:PepSY domain-containing protein n=1 Tax=Streptomyces sioyaensis TaxID=67364 RepID=UPI001F1D5C5F|nr:PepSY domain-containing protein [Streptomyces sioyaensis]MCF3176469.1 PepSY domain-containing protein [Streptomyces sioyaensis]